ncbi:multidrug efflux SMR transporter [uncultured Salinicola sp.]|uniref:DMT family transporter n=1 Tax=uncultured Salinicola sp. TaxID=1193542 RepID=UPI0026021031|nr:multidrug efflux SMR transporter [uncultured Salinicola sp.]|tara:strand:+ start:794 stop:1123 length:330 start_codon:yes stop_codon:yes gene_type:complete
MEPTTLHWIALLVSGAFEIVGVAGFDRLNRGQRLHGMLLLVVGFGSSLGLLSIAMRSIDMGVAYAIFTGIGTLGSTLMGMLLWGESRRPLRLAFVGMIVSAVVGLKLVS